MIKILSWGVGTFSTPGKPNSENFFFSTFWTPPPSPGPGWPRLGIQKLQILDTRICRFWTETLKRGARGGPDPARVSQICRFWIPRLCRFWTETLNRGARGGPDTALVSQICSYWATRSSLSLLPLLLGPSPLPPLPSLPLFLLFPLFPSFPRHFPPL